MFVGLSEPSVTPLTPDRSSASKWLESPSRVVPVACEVAFGNVNMTDTSIALLVGFASVTSKNATGIDVRSSSPATIGDQNRMDTFDWKPLYVVHPNGYKAA